MKIDKSRVYTADIYVVTKATLTETDIGNGDVFSSINHEEERTNKKVIMVRFGKRLVPIWYLQTKLQYLDISSRSSQNGFFKEDDRFLSTKPTGKVGERFVKDVKHLFANTNGKTTLEELVKQQKIHAKHDDEYAPTM